VTDITDTIKTSQFHATSCFPGIKAELL